MKSGIHNHDDIATFFSKKFGAKEEAYDCLYVVQNGKFQFVNPEFAAIGGYAVEEMLGMESVSLIHPDDRKKARDHAVKMLRGESTLPYTFRIIAKGGSVKWIQETVHPISYKGKRSVLGNSMDVTEQKEALEKLGDPQALQSAILDALPIAVIGMNDRRIVLANHAVEAVFGWKPDELIGKNSRVFYRNDKDYEEIGKAVYRTLQKQRTYKLEFPCRRKDGADIICLLSVARIGEYLKDRKIIATYEDITERKRAEKALEESERTLKELVKNYQKK